MEGYCGVEDVKRALRGSTSAGGGNSSTAADLADADIQDSINEATALIDGFIGGPYEPEEEPVPPIIRYLCRDIAAYYSDLVWRRAKGAAEGSPVVLRFKAAMDVLDKLADGKLDLMGPMNVAEQAEIANQYTGNLFNICDFDLTGRTDPPLGFPLRLEAGALVWTADQE